MSVVISISHSFWLVEFPTEDQNLNTADANHRSLLGRRSPVLALQAISDANGYLWQGVQSSYPLRNCEHSAVNLQSQTYEKGLMKRRLSTAMPFHEPGHPL